MASWARSPSAMSVGASSHRRGESSMSVNRNVTVPRGSPRGMLSVHPGELREVSPRVAEVPELLLEHGVEALAQWVRAVLEHVDRSSEVGRRDRRDVLAKAGGAIAAHRECF